ncbi:hypothetical protein SKAU_G00387940 [Synaphobranchus kaupii]|uniref:LIM and calponin homology domains-containing protein 1 n=1 Tax=Synaphobranchus kaupii TaxID=118154 RepID=A0A9Q1EB20_SYNKA|nr:hypothetical protein SKAU_G00387940 [Synaphobranchus kaupii]
MASPGFDIGRNSHSRQQSESAPEPAFQEAQKWIEAVTGLRFGEKDFRSSLENGILLCELLSSIKPGLVKKINRLPTPIAGLDNVSLFLRGCESVGLSGTQLFHPGDLQDTSVRANPRGSDCSRKLKNVLITLYWLGTAAETSTSYSGPTLDLKKFEGLLDQMRKESEDTESQRNMHTPSPDGVIGAGREGRGSDSEPEAPPRKLLDVRKDDMLTRRTGYSETRTATPFNQYLPNKSNHSTYIPTPLRKKRAEHEEGQTSGSTATSPIGGERPFSHPETIPEEGSVLEERHVPCKGQLIEAGHVRQKTVTWGGESRVEPGLWEGPEEQEVRRRQKLEKAGIRVLPATARYSSFKPVAGEEAKEEAPPPVPSIILRKDNDFPKLQQEHAWESEEEENEEERRLPDVQKDDLASRRARMSRHTPRVHHFLPSANSSRDMEKCEAIRRAWQQAALSESEAYMVPRKEEGAGPQTLPNVEKDDLSRRRTQNRPLPLRDPLQALVQPSMTPSDLEKWQRLKMATEPRDPLQALVQPSMTPSDLEKWQRLKMATEPSETPPTETPQMAPRKEGQEGRGQAGTQALPNVEKDDLSRRRTQNRPLPLRDPLQALVQPSMTPSDLEKWQRLKMATEPSEAPAVCQACLEKGSQPPTVRAEPVEQDHLATRRSHARHCAPSGRQRFVHFGPVTEMDQKRWERLSIAQPGPDEEQWAGPGSEAQTLRRLLASAAVATPTIGLSSQLTDRPASAGLGDRDSEVLLAAGSGPDRATPYELAYRQNEALDQKLAQYKECEEEEDEEAGEREEKLPDLEKDDMLLRRTGAFLKPSAGPFFNRFLPLPGSHRVVLPKTKTEDLPDTPKTKTEDLPDTPKTKTEDLPDTPKTKTEDLPDTPKTKTEDLPDTPKTKTESLADAPKTKTEGLRDAPKTKTEGLRDSPKTKTEGLRDSPKTKTEDLRGAPKTKTEDLRGDSEREHFLDGSKMRGQMKSSSPKTIQELSVARPELHNPEPQKHTIASAKPGPGVAEVVQATVVCQGSPEDYIDDDDDDDDDDVYEEECLPDLEKDDMHARRTGQFQKVPVGGVTPTFRLYLPVPGFVKFKSTPTPTSAKLEKPTPTSAKLEKPTPTSAKLEKPTPTSAKLEKPTPTSAKLEKPTPTSAKLEKPTPTSAKLEKHSSDLFSSELYHPPMATAAGTTAATTASITMTIPGAGTPRESPDSRECPNVALKPAPHTISPKHSTSIPASPMLLSSTQQGQAEDNLEDLPQRPSWLEALPPMSVSMTDMRCEEDTVVLPLNEELMHDQHKHREEDQWQDDLARWKKRRRTASQKLIKKEEERKLMETLMTGDRRKSIKTYKEIVEEKERREQELHEAYLSAGTPEEAAAVLRHYMLRFTISEAALERLQLPKALDPAGPAPSSETNALIPKISATLETVTMALQTQIKAPVQACSMKPTPTRAPPSKPMALLGPKPYIQPTKLQMGLKSVKSGDGAAHCAPAESPAPPTQASAHTPATPPLSEGLGKDGTFQVDHWSWDLDEERKRQERWQQKQELLLQERYEQEQEKLRREWESAQKEVQEDERKHHEEERRILEETHTAFQSLASPADPQHTAFQSLASLEHKQELLEKQATCPEEVLMGQDDNTHETHRSGSPASAFPSSIQPQSPNRSVSGRKLCSSCAQPLGKGAAMIIESLSLYFHMQCFQCGVCKGQLGDTSTGTDVRIRNGLLNCHQCYIRSRAAGQPTIL